MRDGITVEETQRQDAQQHVDSGQHQQEGQVHRHDGQGLCGRGHGVQDETHEHAEGQQCRHLVGEPYTCNQHRDF